MFSELHRIKEMGAKKTITRWLVNIVVKKKNSRILKEITPNYQQPWNWWCHQVVEGHCGANCHRSSTVASSVIILWFEMIWIKLHLIDDISLTLCRNHFTSTAQTSRGQIWINHFRSVVSAIAERVDNSFHSESWIRWRFKQRSIAVQTRTSHSFLRHCTGPWMLGSSSCRPGTTLARERLHPWNLRHPPGTRIQTFRSLHQILHQSIVSRTNAQRPQVIIPHNKIWAKRY